MFHSYIPPPQPASKPPKRLTKAQVAALLFAGIVGAVQPLITGYIDYIDTLRILTRKRVPPVIRQALKDTVGGDPNRIAYGGTMAIDYAQEIVIQRPTAATFKCLVELLPGHIVAGLQIARDHLTHTESDADFITRFLHHSLTQSWHGDNEMEMYQDKTMYLAHRSITTRAGLTRPPRRNARAYARLSKVADAWCCHVEGIYTTDVCRRRHVHTAADLFDLDIAGWLNRDLKLAALVWKLIDKRINEEARQRANNTGKPQAAILREMHHRICRAVKNPDNPPQTWYDLADCPVQACIEAHDIFKDWSVRVHLSLDDIVSNETQPENVLPDALQPAATVV